MNEQKTLEIIKKFAARLPKFPDGRINYSNSRVAPVVTIFVKHKDKILILKRSNKVGVYQNMWNTVAGYLDELKPIHEKILQEVREELGVDRNSISIIRLGRPYSFADSKVGKTWIVHPVLVELKTRPKIKLDWEHIEHKWIEPKELKGFDTVPKLEKSLARVLNLNIPVKDNLCPKDGIR